MNELNTVSDIDAIIAELTGTISKDEQTVMSIRDEIASLRNRLDELTNNRTELNFRITKNKEEKQRMANKREQLLREKLANEAIAETAQKVYDLMKGYPGWEAAHDYQKDDIVAAIHAYLSGYTGFMNANDMGMGKTMESLLIVRCINFLFEAEHGREPRLLWLTKSSILKTGGTVREAKRWYPELKIVPVNGSMPSKDRETMFEMIEMMNAHVITNYETCRTTNKLNEMVWDIIVMDEVHKLKGGANPSGPTAVWKAVKSVAENARMTLMLSGTPMVNRPAEMWAYLHIFDQDRFPSLRQFENMFTVYKTIGYETQIAVDADRLLNNALKGRMIRRRKDEVGIQMPSVTPYEDREKLLEMNPDQREVYDQMKNQFFIWLDEQDPDAVFTATAIIAQLSRLRQINIWPVIDFKIYDEEGNQTGVKTLRVESSSKIDEVMEDIDALGDEQFVLFCSFNEPLKEVQRRCKELGVTCELLIGENSSNLAQLEVGFQQGEIQVLCINNAMGEGLNLQKNPSQWPGGSSYVGFLDLWWNPARNDQCTDRVFRQGANEAVTVIHYKNESSVDQYIDAIIADKSAEISGVAEAKQLRPSDWKEFLKDKI